LLSPDIVFQLGPVKRFIGPTQDILWIKRTDAETPVYDAPKSAGIYRMHVADWKLWSTPKGTSPMEDSYLMTANGMMFLSRGRVVVTDRLHGFILCTLLNIPHVFIDNKQHKLSNYHNTWTHGLENLIMASSSADAVVQAQYLLKKLDKELPQITGYYKNTGY
jgi:exopolysaccharide biosynthesis predicted pyruvyltransferase EpsI